MNKKIAIIGSTGNILSKLCEMLSKDNYDLIFVDRNINKSIDNKNKCLKINNSINIDLITCNLESIESVKEATIKLLDMSFDYLILGAGIYNVKLKQLELGYNNVFQVNFISMYYIANKLLEKNKDLKVIVVGSVAYKYTPINLDDIDLSLSKKQTHIYGNSKRFLMFSLMKKYNDNVVITHPGITYSSMTSHYPKLINWLVVLFIRLFFPSNKKAAKNIYYGINHDTKYLEWIGPGIFYVYGRPKIKQLKIDEKEIINIYDISEKIYNNIK